MQPHKISSEIRMARSHYQSEVSGKTWANTMKNPSRNSLAPIIQPVWCGLVTPHPPNCYASVTHPLSVHEWMNGVYRMADEAVTFGRRVCNTRPPRNGNAKCCRAVPLLMVRVKMSHWTPTLLCFSSHLVWLWNAGLLSEITQWCDVMTALQ